MAVKKAATAEKAPARKAAAKKPTAGKAAVRKGASKGDSYVCGVCGLAVTVDEDCGCVDVCDIICCGEPMKAKKPRAKAATTKKPRAKAGAAKK
ncbi:MAG: hypothetical protein HYX79_05870 [Chloroflexi bacterium]|nr:hypothetical protein [Chloroflexota bacterium]